MKKIVILLILVLTSCGNATPTAEMQVVNVYATPSAQPWLTNLYACAAKSGVTLKVDGQSPEIYLRLGEPESLVSPAYKIDEEEILIVAQRESHVQISTLLEAQDSFAMSNPSMQAWIYSSEADVQKAFDQLVMKGRSVASSARIAVSPQNMSDVLKSELTAIGILPRHWLIGDVREVYSAGKMPVLAVTKSLPQAAVIKLISCLQDN
jgi:hypothetical protein